MTEEWATCIECGWIGIIDISITVCPLCGYIGNKKVTLTEGEKRDLVAWYGRGGFVSSTRFMSKWNGWKR